MELPFKFTIKEGILPYLKSFFLVFSIAVGWYFMKTTSWGSHLSNNEWIRLAVIEKGSLGTAAFVVVGAVTTLFGFPRLAISTIGGFVFGFTKGFFCALSATMLGCILTFYYARVLARNFVQNRLPQQLGKYEAMLSEHSFYATLVVRLFPAGSNTLTNLIAGVSSAKPAPYFAGSFLGYIPQTVIFALMGSGIRKEIWLRGGLSVLLFAVSILLMLFVYKKMKQG